jgi:uncharacterized protein DUF4124
MVVALLLAAAASAAGTTLYKWTDAQGVVHYSDSPQPGAEQVHVAPVQTYSAPPAPATPPASRTSSSSGGASSSGSSGAAKAAVCSITAPQPDQSFFSPDSVAIAVSVNPPLQDGDSLQVTYDGTPVSAADLNPIIQEPSRGAHSVSASVRGPDGTVRCMAAPVTFNVQRPSALSPQSPVRAH